MTPQYKGLVLTGKLLARYDKGAGFVYLQLIGEITQDGKVVQNDIILHCNSSVSGDLTPYQQALIDSSGRDFRLEVKL